MSSLISIFPSSEIPEPKIFMSLSNSVTHFTYVNRDYIFVQFSDSILTPSPGAGIGTSYSYFIPYVNGNQADIKQAYVSSMNTSMVVIQLFSGVFPQDQVNLSFICSSNNNFTFSGSETISSWNMETVTNYTVFHDPHYTEIQQLINKSTSAYPNSPFYEYDPSSNNITNSIVVVRTPPTGNVVINESVNTNGMQVLTFAPLGPQSQAVNGTLTTPYAISNTYNAIIFHSYAEQGITTAFFTLGITGTPINNADNLIVKVYQDILGQPGKTLLGISSVIPYSSLSGTPTNVGFPFQSLTVGQGDYWFILSPNDGMNLPVGATLNTYSGTDNSSLYFDTLLQSNDNSTWTNPGFLIEFQLSAKNGVAIPSFAVTEDALEQEINQATNFGGATNPSLSETIGDGNARSIRLDLLSTDAVSSIEIGSIANGVTEYMVEYKIGTSSYTQLFSMISSQQTRDFYIFKFTNPLSNVSSVRVRSLGDFYYQDNNASLTLAAEENIINVTGVQLSRFSDFRDVNNIYSFDSYPGGIAVKPWELTSSSSLYLKFGDRTTTQPRYVGSFIYNDGIQFLVADKNKFYSFPSTDSSDVAVIAYDLDDPFETITSFLNYNQAFYFGTAKGYVYKTTDGKSFIQMNSQPLAGPVKSLAFYLNSLIAGIINFDTTSSIKLYQFIEVTPGQFINQVLNISYSIVENSILSMVVGIGELYISCGDYTNNTVATIYKYNGSTLTQSLVYFTPITCMFYSQYSTTIYATNLNGELLTATYSGGILGAWSKILDIGSEINQIMEGTNAAYLILTSKDSVYFYDKINQVIINADTLPFESVPNYYGLKNTWYNYNANYTGLDSGNYFEEYTNLNYSTIPAGIANSNMALISEGYISFNSTGNQNLILNYNSSNATVYIDDNIQILDNSGNFTVSFVANTPRKFKLTYNTYNTSVNLNLQLMYYVGIASTVLPTTYLLPPIYATGVSNPLLPKDVLATSNRAIYSFDFNDAISYKKYVYVRYQDSLGNSTSLTTPFSDYIYKNIQRSIFDDATPSGSLIEVNSSKTTVSTFVPPEGSYQQLYSPDRLVRLKAIYESEPFYAPDITSWNQLGILAYIPTGTIVSSSDYGTSVTIYAKQADDALTLETVEYDTSSVKSTINSQINYGSVTSVLLNIQSFTKKWIKFKIVMETATAGVTPVVQAATVTYFASGQSKFFTKLFDTSVHSTVSPPPTIRRGLLTANYALNGGTITFGYTTEIDPSKAFDFSLYTLISPNTVFELPVPSSTIRFAALLTTGSVIATVLDELAVQLDTGTNDLYFMPPEALFSYKIGLAQTVAFTSNAVGQISKHVWSFGTSAVIGIPPDSLSDPLVNRVNPVVQYTPNPVGLLVTYVVQGFTQNGITFQSEVYSKTLS